MVAGALAALAYVVAVLTAVHFVRRDIDPVMQPISAYALGPGGRWFAAALVAWGASGWLLEGALGEKTSRTARVLLTVFGAGLITAAVFPMDVPFPPNEWTLRRLSWGGIVHIGGASAASIAFPILAFLLSRQLAPVRALQAMAVSSAIAAAAVFTAPFVAVRLFGAAQRLLAALILAWLLTAAVSLVRRGCLR